MTSAESLALIRRARKGDREAWDALCKRYYPRWLNTFHGQLGRGLRELHDTPDLVQSAIADALRDIGDLRSEAAFYSWVSAIVRRKIAEKRRREAKAIPLRLDHVGEPGKTDSRLEGAAATDEEYIRLLDAIIVLFRDYPEAMAAVYLKYFEKLDIHGIMMVFGKSERGAYRLLETAFALLRSKLPPP